MDNDISAPAELALGAPAELARLLEVMARLRDPGRGCPWDQQQTFETIAPYTIEEAYEVADAIARRDMAELPDELGDLLFQVVYHARIAEEEGSFSFVDVAETIHRKMVSRHPHVFGDATARDSAARRYKSARFRAKDDQEYRAARIFPDAMSRSRNAPSSRTRVIAPASASA